MSRRRRRGQSASAEGILSGAVLWLAADELIGYADGDGIVEWPNLSSSGATATQSNAAYRPQYKLASGVPVVRNVTAGGFDLAFPSAQSSDEVTVFLVANETTASTSTRHLFKLGTSADQSKLSVVESLGELAVINGNGRHMAGLLVEAAPSVLCVAASVSGGGTAEGRGCWLYRDGELAFRQQNSNAEAWTSYTGMTAGFIGGIGTGQGSHFAGDYQAVAYFDRRLTDAEVARVMSYLATRYSIVEVTPTEVLVFDGDSITVGLGVIDAYTNAVLRDQTPRFRAYNVGVSGQTVAQMAADAATQVDPLYDAAMSRNLVLAWAGTNDLNAGTAPATVYANLVTYCTARRAAGFKVAVFTCLPRGAVAQFETDRQTLNTSIRTNWATFADALVDVGADATIGAAGAQNNTTYYNGDKIHLTTAGYTIVKGLVNTAIAAL